MGTVKRALGILLILGSASITLAITSLAVIQSLQITRLESVTLTATIVAVLFMSLLLKRPRKCPMCFYEAGDEIKDDKINGVRIK